MDNEGAVNNKVQPDVTCDMISKPSKTISVHEATISIEDVPINLTLVAMKHSLLLVIHDSDSQPVMNLGDLGPADRHVSREVMIQGFMNSNSSLRGLALGIGEHGTCIISSDNALNSATLASRISKKLNANRPVYVANNLTQPQQVLDSDIVIAKFYMRVFQFIRSHYNCAEPRQETSDGK